MSGYTYVGDGSNRKIDKWDAKCFVNRSDQIRSDRSDGPLRAGVTVKAAKTTQEVAANGPRLFKSKKCFTLIIYFNYWQNN